VFHDLERDCCRDEAGSIDAHGGGDVLSPSSDARQDGVDSRPDERRPPGPRPSAGWQRNEYDAHGYPYPSNQERLDQLREGIQLIKAMWTEEAPAYRGRYFSIDKAYNNPRPVQRPHPPIMVGGSGSKLLPITAAEADIANLIPPIIHGKDALQDPLAAVRFDKRDLKQRIEKLRNLIRASGREVGSVTIGGFVLVNLTRDKATADGALKAIASSMGYPSEEAARNSPSLLIGTPEEVKRELRSRLEELGITYYVVFPASEQSRDLLASDVMPAFGS
jgi:alkanesulfonate monooxygenase SsuD/methylene tetrahydromethanopterin reductase-like flavin-dependent oxidoreductase (luciferase family)